MEHGLDVLFPNYAVFWRCHIVPATNRPANIDLRKEAGIEVGRIGTISHSVLIDLVNAADSLERIRAGDLGGERFRNCTDAIKCDGDAVQKFTDLQKAIEGPLATKLGRKIEIWSNTDWESKWFPSREKIIGYRNFLTHMGQPRVMVISQAENSLVPYVLHQDYIVRGQCLTWAEQEAVYRSNPEKWARFVDVCEELHRNSINWLNDAYGEIIHALQPLLTDEDYHWLWGWDTQRGRHIWQQQGAIGAQGPLPSGASFGGFSPGSGQGG
jgi:hypothetical protein